MDVQNPVTDEILLNRIIAKLPSTLYYQAMLVTGGLDTVSSTMSRPSSAQQVLLREKIQEV